MIKWLIILATQWGTQVPMPTGHCHNAVILEGMNRAEVMELLGTLEGRMEAALNSHREAVDKNFTWVGEDTPEGYGKIVDILEADHKGLDRNTFAFRATHTLRETEGETSEILLRLHKTLKTTDTSTSTSILPWIQNWEVALQAQQDAVTALAYASPITLHDIFAFDNISDSHHRNRLMLKWVDAQLQYARTLLHLARME